MPATVVDCGDTQLHVSLRPGGPTIVLLHGLAGTADEWHRTADALPHHWGIIAPDLRAHGRSRRDHQPALEAERFTLDVITVIETLASTPIMLAGQSMGGVIATRVAAARPDLIRHLVLIDAGVAPAPNDSSDLERWLRTSDTGHDPDSMLAVAHTVNRTSRATEWGAVTCPTTVVLAERTFIADRDIATMAAAQPTTTWLSILSSGHDIHLDQPTALGRALSGLR
ncbi:MAG: alpha/beta fold hydrolase [Actinomycetota bacterium]